MNKETINEGNALIADFEHGKILPFPLHLAEYHTSWDWLMSVISKINASVKPDKNADDYLTAIIRKLALGNIESTWVAVAEFIKYYNTKTNEESKTDSQKDRQEPTNAGTIAA